MKNKTGSPPLHLHQIATSAPDHHLCTRSPPLHQIATSATDLHLCTRSPPLHQIDISAHDPHLCTRSLSLHLQQIATSAPDSLTSAPDRLTSAPDRLTSRFQASADIHLAPKQYFLEVSPEDELQRCFGEIFIGGREYEEFLVVLLQTSQPTLQSIAALVYVLVCILFPVREEIALIRWNSRDAVYRKTHNFQRQQSMQ